MSVLMGKNGYEVGSVDYFKNLNEKGIIGGLLREFCGSSSSTQYGKAIEGLCKRAQDAIYDIHTDLKQYASSLRYFPGDERESLAREVNRLNGLSKFASSYSSTADSCLSLLSLAAFETHGKSGESMSSLQDAAKRVRDGGSTRMSYSTGYDLMRRAASDGVQWAAGSDLTKQLFFDEMVGNRSKEFVQDLWGLMYYEEEKGRFTGRCGRVICSRDYIEKIQQQVFGAAQSRVRDCESYYEEIFSSLEGILLTISMDFSLSNGYILADKADATIAALKEIEKYGLQVDALYGLIRSAIPLQTNQDWSFNIQRLQQDLNEMGKLSPDFVPLKEDGIYGQKTDNAMQQLFRALLGGASPRIKPEDRWNRAKTGLSVDTITMTKSSRKPNVLKYYNGLPELPDSVDVPFLFKDKPGKTETLTRISDSLPFKAVEQKPSTVIHYDIPHGLKGNNTNIKYHINIQDMDYVKNNKILNAIYEQIPSQYIHGADADHIEIPDFTIKIVSNWDMVKRTFKIGNRIFVAAGYAMDALSIYQAIMEDIKDDQPGFPHLHKTIVEIVYAETLSFVGATIGAIAGSAAGLPGSIVFGILGGMIGYAIGKYVGEYVVEITDVVLGG